jgi:hypothetical protein
MEGMTLAWLFFRGKDGMAGAILVEASSLFEARAYTTMAGLESGLTFASGYMLDVERSAMIASEEIGRRFRWTRRRELSHGSRPGDSLLAIVKRASKHCASTSLVFCVN